ncbi:hypothetical protein AB0B48_09150 [Micromonospora sp. NPDC049089]|uniref:hypothetical protein n=1 Tax=Micromonospora sp. NPDC049089 TaxID=3155496 RepID=UPI0033E05C9F
MSYDHGPVQTYEITWKSGHIESVLAHQVSWPRRGMALVAAGMLTGLGDDQPKPSVIHFHAEIDGHWLLTLSAHEDDIQTIRLVTQAEVLPGGAS